MEGLRPFRDAIRRAERWECDETVYYRSNPEPDPYRPISRDDIAAIRNEFEQRERGSLLD
ncbi:MAG: hypothetical protein VCE43_12825 [Myxococcota bacterium]